MNTKSLTEYELIYELLHDGQGNLFPELEPISVKELVKCLEQRHRQGFEYNVDAWADWFIVTARIGTPTEKKSIQTIRKIRYAEKEALSRLDDEATDS